MQQIIRNDRAFGWGCSLYPSGHFTLYRKNEQKTLGLKEAFVSCASSDWAGSDLATLQQMYGVEIVQHWWEASALLGLPGVPGGSSHPVNAVVELGSSTPVKTEKKRRGLGGLTSRGRNLVREGAIALENHYGRKRLTFWTLTLPAMSREDYESVCQNWSKITENLKKKLRYHLRMAGLPQHVVGVTELQTQRWERDRVPGWHLHLIYVGCRSNGGWVLTPKLADKLWRDAVSEYTHNQYDFRSSSKLERVRKSVGGYLSKYLSKGGAVIEQVEDQYPGCVPSSWYVCTSTLRSWVDSNTLKGGDTAAYLYQLIQDSPGEIRGLWAYCIETRPGQPLAVCWMGVLPDLPVLPLLLV